MVSVSILTTSNYCKADSKDKQQLIKE